MCEDCKRNPIYIHSLLSHNFQHLNWRMKGNRPDTSRMLRHKPSILPRIIGKFHRRHTISSTFHCIWVSHTILMSDSGLKAWNNWYKHWGYPRGTICNRYRKRICLHQRANILKHMLPKILQSCKTDTQGHISQYYPDHQQQLKSPWLIMAWVIDFYDFLFPVVVFGEQIKN